MQPKHTTIAVVGLGYVGLPLAVHAVSRGFNVIGFDIDEVKVAQLERREANFLDAGAQKDFREARSLAITSHEGALQGADIFIVCVPTPVNAEHMPDLRPLESAAAVVGRALTEGALVVIESTVNPGVCEEVALPILERESGLRRGEFLFAHCPERINPGDKEWSVRNIPRVVGGYDLASRARALELYRTLIAAEVRAMGSLKETEAVKMVENSFRDINIAFVNELAMAFDRAGIDVVNVIRAAATKPFGFMAHYPGCGVGGHCIPVDPYYLIRFGYKNGFEHRFLKVARHTNNAMPGYTVDLLSDQLRVKKKRLKRARVALLGLAYKRDVSDTRESPALIIRDLLTSRGADVRTYDPYALSHSNAKKLEDALKDTDAAIIATDHRAFCSLTPHDFQKYHVDIVIDGRNCLDKRAFQDAGILYKGIGH